MRIKMSGYEIPFHIQEEIMKRLPVKSLIQFRSVSKAWKSLIDSSDFIAAHCFRCHTQPQHLLVSYDNMSEVYDYALLCTSYIGDDTFPQQRSVVTLPPSVKGLPLVIVVGSSHGLLCLYASGSLCESPMIVLWNPSIRKCIVVDLPEYRSYSFGVCPVTGDPKILAITQPFKSKDIETNYGFEVMVYTLSSGKWRTLSTNLCTKPLLDLHAIVVTDGFIYWRVGLPSHNMLLSFDVTNESFEVLDLPDILACHDRNQLYLCHVPHSLTMREYRGGIDICTLWVMEHGVQKLFTKRFTINAPGCIVGFRKNGVPIIHVVDGDPETDSDDVYEPPKRVVFEPNSEHNNVFEIAEDRSDFKVHSYMETLLLLGWSDCSSY